MTCDTHLSNCLLILRLTPGFSVIWQGVVFFVFVFRSLKCSCSKNSPFNHVYSVERRIFSNHVSVMSTAYKKNSSIPRKPAEGYFMFWMRKRKNKKQKNAYKKDPDHASVDCSTERNTRRPLRTQLLTQCGNIKENSEAWNKRTQLAVQSTQLYRTEWDIFCWDVTRYIFHRVRTVKSAENKKALVTNPEILLGN